MNKRRLFSVSIAVLLAIFFISAVSARGGEFVVEPLHEVTEIIGLTVSDEVLGNVSVSNGFIDFYVTSPSGAILLCYNKTAFKTFKFTARENGNYTMHLANTYQTENVNGTLYYALHVMVVLQSNIGLKFDVETTSAISPPTTTIPFDLRWILTLILPFIREIVKTVKEFVRWLRWISKYRKSRTPVVICEH